MMMMMLMRVRADDDDVQLEETISCVRFKRLVQFSNRPALTDLRISRRYSPSTPHASPHGAFSPGPFAAWKRQSKFTGGFFREIFQQVWSWVVEHGASCQGFGKCRATARRRRLCLVRRRN
ncbi:hypothetical protein CY35_08G117200 [Sphagnum magellanicum]|nr:hypothetical protein CY35_08G117200 [Sphagnum magellanicum]